MSLAALPTLVPAPEPLIPEAVRGWQVHRRAAAYLDGLILQW